MDELTSVIQSIIDSELDDLILDLVYDLHSSMKGLPDDQLDLVTNGQKTKQSLSSSLSQNFSTTIEKQTCRCPHCGQTNIIAVRFAYHLAKCLGKLVRFCSFRNSCFQPLADDRLVRRNIVLSIK